MTVEELIKVLRTMPKDKEVYVLNQDQSEATGRMIFDGVTRVLPMIEAKDGKTFVFIKASGDMLIA